MTMRRNILFAAAACVTLTSIAAAQAIRHVQGSQNAMTIAPATQPAPSAADSPAAFHGSGMQSPKTGALRVVFTQGPNASPATGHDPVTVELYNQGKPIHTYSTQIGDDGRIEIHDLPLDVPFQPVVTVSHAGALEEIIGPPMHKMQPAVELQMTIYEPTVQKPDWTSGIRHVAVEAVATNDKLTLHVTEMMGGFNPTNFAWTGDHNVTLTLHLPPNAQDVLLGQGLAESNPTIANGVITRAKAMMPGATEYDFGYTVPVTQGAAQLSFTLPADTSLFALYLPATFKIEKAVGLTANSAGGKYAVEGRQLLVGKHLKAGEVLTVDLSGITPPPPPPAPITLPGGEGTTLHLPHPAAPEAKP